MSYVHVQCDIWYLMYLLYRMKKLQMPILFIVVWTVYMDVVAMKFVVDHQERRLPSQLIKSEKRSYDRKAITSLSLHTANKTMSFSVIHTDNSLWSCDSVVLLHDRSCPDVIAPVTFLVIFNFSCSLHPVCWWRTVKQKEYASSYPAATLLSSYALCSLYLRTFHPRYNIAMACLNDMRMERNKHMEWQQKKRCHSHWSTSFHMMC